MNTTPALDNALADFAAAMPHDPLAHPGLIRILLSERASQALTESGERYFTIISRDTYPGNPRRWCITLQPLPDETLQDACRVIAGTHAARRIKAAPQGQPRANGGADFDGSPITPEGGGKESLCRRFPRSVLPTHAEIP